MDAADEALPILPDADEDQDDAESREQNASPSLVSQASANTRKSDTGITENQDTTSLRQASEEDNEKNEDNQEQTDEPNENNEAAQQENDNAPDAEQDQPMDADGDEGERINVPNDDDAAEERYDEGKDKEASGQSEEVAYDSAPYVDDFIAETERAVELDGQEEFQTGDGAGTEEAEVVPPDDLNVSKNTYGDDGDDSDDGSNESEDSEDDDGSEEQSTSEEDSANDEEISVGESNAIGEKEDEVAADEQMDTDEANVGDAEATNIADSAAYIDEANNQNESDPDPNPNPNEQDAEQGEENNADDTSVTKRAPRVHFSLTTAIEVERPDDGETSELQSVLVDDQAANEQTETAVDDQAIENATVDQDEQPDDATVANQATDDESKPIENSYSELAGLAEETATPSADAEAPVVDHQDGGSQQDMTIDEREADVAVVVEENERNAVEGEQSQPVEPLPDAISSQAEDAADAVAVEIDIEQKAATSDDHVVIDLDGVAEAELQTINSAQTAEQTIEQSAENDPQLEIETATLPAGNDKSAKASDVKSARAVNNGSSEARTKREEPLLRKVSLKRITSASGMSQQAQGTARARPTTARVKPTAPMVTQLSSSSTGSVRPKSAITALKKPNQTVPPARKLTNEKDQKKKEKPDGKDEQEGKDAKEKKPQKTSGASSATNQKAQGTLQNSNRQKSASKLTKRQTSMAIKTGTASATNSGKPNAEARAAEVQKQASEATADPKAEEQPSKETENAKITTPTKTDPAVQRSDSVNLLKAPNLSSKDAVARDSDDESTAKQGKDQMHSLNADSMTYNAIPYLPVGCAVLCLFLNIVLPGAGTIVAGFASLCCGQMRTHSKEPDEARFNTVCINFWVGFSQLVTVVLLLVGWFWSVAWGIHIMTLSLEYRKRAIKKAEKAQQQQARSRLSLPA